nr:hypothetical protein [Streptomyces antibioticus]
MNERLTHHQDIADPGTVGLAVAALTGRTMLGTPAREWFNR